MGRAKSGMSTIQTSDQAERFSPLDAVRCRQMSMSGSDPGRWLAAGGRATLTVSFLKGATTVIVMIAATVVILLVFVGAASVVARHLEIESSSSWPYSGLFMSPRLPDRPRGTQEEDLPRFVFRDAPWSGAK